MFECDPTQQRGDDEMGNHRNDAVNQKQHGNPSANRPELVSPPRESDDVIDGTREAGFPIALSSNGDLILKMKQLSAKATDCQRRSSQAMGRIELAFEAKTEFFERLAERAEEDLHETVTAFNSRGV